MIIIYLKTLIKTSTANPYRTQHRSRRRKPAEKDNKTADKSEDTKPAIAKVEKYKFKERMTKESYDLDSLKEALTTLPDKE